MRRAMLIFILMAGCVLGAFGGDAEFAVRGSKERVAAKGARAAKKAEVARVVPHLAVNEEWVSTLTIRSDALSEIYMVLEFYDINGNPVQTTFYDSFNDQYVNEIGFVIPDLAPGEIYSLDFDTLVGARNLQVFAYTDETEIDYSLEAIYNRFGSAGQKTAFVGVPVQAPGQFFVINLDQRLDAYTGNQKFRGVALTNSAISSCDCQATLFDELGYAIDEFGQRVGNPGDLYPLVQVDIAGSAKWLGVTFDLLEDIDTLLPSGLGYLFFDCTENVSALGLAFENGTAVTSSVPIDYFFPANKSKNGEKPTNINQFTKRQ